jgi:hypothetical protein
MYTSRTRHVAALLIFPFVVAAAACDLAFNDFRATASSDWHKTYDLAPGGHVEIANVNGKIQVQPSSGNAVEVTARRIAKAASDDAAKQAIERIEIRETASPSSVRVETKMQRGGSSFFSGASLEVQYVVRVPAGADVKFTNVNGGVEITGLAGQVTAETVNGGIKLMDVSGGVRASTVNGGVVAELARVSDAGVRLECTNGGIKLRLPANARANLSAHVMNGGIATNGLDIDASGESSRRRLEGRLNGGGPKIEIAGTNGGISIGARLP